MTFLTDLFRSVAYWYNGLTRTLQLGTPPADWVRGADGYYYPTTVALPTPPSNALTPPTTINPTPLVPPYDPTEIPTPIPTPPGTINPTPLIPPNGYRYPPITVSYPIRVVVTTLPIPNEVMFPVKVAIAPPIPVFTPSNVNVSASLTIVPIPIALKSGTFSVIKKLLMGKVDSFFDNSRVLKTLLNFGDDYQALMTNWKLDPADVSGSTMLVKLYSPLPDDIEEKTQSWIVRELSPPVIDRLYTKFTPPPPPKVYLRPANRNIALVGTTGTSVEKATLTTLLTTGSTNVMRTTDPIVEEWFTSDINSVELNIDYSDYRNFVFFGSAEGRVNAFIQKLRLLQEYDTIITFQSASITSSGSLLTNSVTSSLAYPALQIIADQRTDLLRSFDGYERFLYYESGSAYSSSLNTEDFQDALYYHTDATWPKISGSVAPISSASTWITTQTAIATAFDAANQNYLANNIPAYLKNDDDSEEFVTFLNLAGHHFDILKTYIDHMTLIYDRSNNPSTGLSPDIIWNVAEAFGIELPNQYAVNRLADFTIGEIGEVSPKIYRDLASETWKRIIHNHIFLLKTKGTATGLRSLANAYGVLPTMLQIREGSIVGTEYSSGSYEIYEEQTNALRFTSSSYVQLPWTAISGHSGSTLELRFATTNTDQLMTIAGADSRWALLLEPLTGSYGRVILQSDLIYTLSSSFFPCYNGEYCSLMLRHTTGGMQMVVKQYDGDDLLHSSTTSEVTPLLVDGWFSPSYLNLGGSGSFFGEGFSGLIDEVRVWDEQLQDDVFDKHARYPGLYNGNDTTAARDNLKIRLSFNKPRDLGISGSLLYNEAPSHPSQSFSVNGFSTISGFPYNMETISRRVQRFTPTAGAGQFSSNKITIEDAPTLMYSSGSSIPVLSPHRSVVTLQEKAAKNKPNNTVGFYFSLTDSINDNVVRSIGNIDLQNLIGDPDDQYSSTYADLESLNTLYWGSYAYSYNINSFVDFVRNLMEPLFAQAKKLVPARAKLLSGIVHEPHILERSKVARRPIEVSGGSITRRQQNETHNLEANSLTSQPDEFTAFAAYHDATFTVSNDYDTVATMGMYESTTDATVEETILSDYLTYEDIHIDAGTAGFTDVGLYGLDSGVESFEADILTVVHESDISSLYDVLDDHTNRIAYKRDVLNRFGVNGLLELTAAQRAEYDKLLARFRSPNNVNISEQNEAARRAMSGSAPLSLINTILPYSNFEDLGATTYFTNPTGLVGETHIHYTRTNQNILRDRGTWTSGVAYSRNDYVTVSGSFEYTCITTDIPFMSYGDPALDAKNWKRMTYVPTLVVLPRKAIVISGSVSLAPTTSIQDAVIGYRPNHFRFTRDMRKGTIRHQWLGCLQDNTTTVDGGPAVEVTFGAGSSLIRTGGEPIQSANDQSGPILDVR